MTASNTTVFELLGKQVSFTRQFKVELPDDTFLVDSVQYSGIVTDVILSLIGGPEIAVDNGEFHSFSKLLEFRSE